MVIFSLFQIEFSLKNTIHDNDKNHYICKHKKNTTMSLLRVLLAIIFPPLAVIDKGCGSILIVFLLTLCAWVPGIIGALVILNKN